MRDYQYSVVDVFAEAALEGNPLAVVPRAEGLDGDAMQRIAREFNLSETVFVLAPRTSESVVRLRIFTPTMEMRFAGHPTVGGAFVALESGVVPAHLDAFVIDEEIGPVPVRVDRSDGLRIWLTTPPIAFGALYDAATCADVLGLAADDLLGPQPQLVTAGNPNIFIAVRDRDAVDRAWLDLAGVRRLHGGEQSADCVFVFAPTREGAYSRMFAPEHGVVEDPATGSATGPLAAFMMRHGLAPHAGGSRFHSEQGTKMGRRSILEIAVRGDRGCDGIDVGGRVVPFASGSFRVPGP
jgi:trans-2,3-dihydro-3-hydroxyanthranilate isomerase